jgi:hypothetical protein
MTDEDIRKLLGGYATRTLSQEEQKALFEAALHDEKLFAALADEHALREMLDDPGNRAAMLQAVRPAPARPAPARRAFRWMVPVSIAAGLVVIASVVFVYQRRPQPVEMAKVVQPALQPEIRVEPPAASGPTAAASAPSPTPSPARARELRQGFEKAPVDALRRDEKQELKARASNSPAAVEQLSDAGNAAPAPPRPASTPAPPSRRASESVEVQATAPLLAPDVAVGTGATNRPAVFRAKQGLVNSAGKVQYTILKRAADGEFKPVDAASPLQPQDAVRLNVEAEETGFLAISQKEPPKMLFQGIVLKREAVMVPATGSLDLNNRGALQIVFRQPGNLGGLQRMLQTEPIKPRSLSKRKAMSEADSQKTRQQSEAVSKDQAAQSAVDVPVTITVDVNLNVAAPAQQKK